MTSTRPSLAKNAPYSARNGCFPEPVVRAVDAVGLIVGIVIGAGIFRTPSIVAANAASASIVYVAWVWKFVSLVGALVYAELATTYPHAGGDYYYLARAFGPRLSFLFGWARMSVIQTGSIASVSYIFGDYATGFFCWAVFIRDLRGVRHHHLDRDQRHGRAPRNRNAEPAHSDRSPWRPLVIVAGLAAVSPAPADQAAPANTSSALGLMMVFVLFTYGGWNEAAYVSGELRDVQKNMARVLVFSTRAMFFWTSRNSPET